MKVVVGSSAVKHAKSFFRSPGDLDIWCTEDEIVDYKCDLSVIPYDIMNLVEVDDGYATIDSIYTIKCSHLGWDILFEKHKRDIIFLKSQGARLITSLYVKLVNHWKAEHGNKDYLSLYKSKNEFFNDHVTYVYDHDLLHKYVAGDEKPLYMKCLKEGEEVAVDRCKFDGLSHEDQINMFKEEITVIAFERWLVNPSSKVNNWLKAYRYALRKTITQLTKNWATEFLVMNLSEMISPNIKYIKNISSKIKEGDSIMSNVEMKTFEAFMAKFDIGEDDLRTVIYNMCEGEFGEIELDIDYKDYDKYRADLEKVEKEWGYKHIMQEGGGEGGSEHCEGIFEFMGKAYRASYSYYSHQGHDFDDIVDTLKEVKPVEKMVVVYE